MEKDKNSLKKIELSRKNLTILTLAGMLVIAFAVLASGSVSSPTEPNPLNSKTAPSLFIGDVGDNTVKRIDANTGKFLGTFVASGSGGLNGPMGLIFSGGKLLVVNQNFGGDNGEILKFNQKTGVFVNKLVASNNPFAPYAPRGIVQDQINDKIIYVADVGTNQNNCSNEGRVARFNRLTGKFLDDLDRSGFTEEFHPRGLVFGPDGLLYVSAIGCPMSLDDNVRLIKGYILRFNPGTQKFIDVFASSDTVVDLHRPEGLVFDEKGNLWVTSFRANPDDSDKILKFNRRGVVIDKLVLAPPVNQGGERAFAQAILFGPDESLFIPISGGNFNTTGQLRRCNVTKMSCDTIVPANSADGPLQSPWYLTFDVTDPSTLAFEED